MFHGILWWSMFFSKKSEMGRSVYNSWKHGWLVVNVLMVCCGLLFCKYCGWLGTQYVKNLFLLAHLCQNMWCYGITTHVLVILEAFCDKWKWGEIVFRGVFVQSLNPIRLKADQSTRITNICLENCNAETYLDVCMFVFMKAMWL